MFCHERIYQILYYQVLSFGFLSRVSSREDADLIAASIAEAHFALSSTRMCTIDPKREHEYLGQVIEFERLFLVLGSTEAASYNKTSEGQHNETYTLGKRPQHAARKSFHWPLLGRLCGHKTAANASRVKTSLLRLFDWTMKAGTKIVLNISWPGTMPMQSNFQRFSDISFCLQKRNRVCCVISSQSEEQIALCPFGFCFVFCFVNHDMLRLRGSCPEFL